MLQLLESHIAKEYSNSDQISIKINYACEVIKSEISKFGLIFIYFLIQGQLKEFIICFLVLIPLRLYSGGMHMRSNLSCLLFTFTIFNSAINWINIITDPQQSHTLFILVASLVTINIIGPIPHVKKPIRTKKKYLRCKRKLFALSLLSCFYLLILRNTDYFKCGTWIIVMQLLQLFPVVKNRTLTKERLI